MTQALINNLNILSDTSVNLTNRMSKNEGMDFGKIFETKTFDYTQVQKDFNQTAAKDTYNKPQNNNPSVNNEQKNTNYTEKNTLKENKQENEQNNEQDDKQNNEQDNSTDNNQITTLEGIVQILAEENTEVTEELIPYTICTDIIDDEDEDDLMPEDIATDNSAEADETTITNEDSTMYNELITLENPTALLMLQSQITQSVNIKTSNEQTETASENLLNSQNGSQNLADDAETAMFKQLDTEINKNPAVINNSPKQTTGIKTTAQRLSAFVNENMIKELNVEVISSQSADTESSMSDFMQNQSPEEHTARVMIQGDVKYESAAAEAAKNASQVKTVNINPSKIIDQITKQMENLFNNSKLNMVLNPGSLGKLNLQLMNTKDGLIAQFTVTTQEARDILMKGLDGLKESLLAQGVNIDNVTVKLEETEGEYKQDYTEQEGSKGGNKHQGAKKQKQQEKDFEQMMFNLENDGNV